MEWQSSASTAKTSKTLNTEMGQIPPWEDLPRELLSAIASSLTSNPIDNLCFRAVCKSWYSSSATPPSSLLSPPLPLRLPCPPVNFSRRFYLSSSTFSLLSATVVYALHPPVQSAPKTWLVFVDELNIGEASVRYPLTMEPLPLPLDFPHKLNLLDFRASEVGRFYNLSHPSVSSGSGKLMKPSTWSQGFLKVVFLSNGSAVVALSDDGKLGFLSLGVGKNLMDLKWEIINKGKGSRFDDIVEYKGGVLGIDRRAQVYDMGDNCTEMNVIVPPITGYWGRRKRLIESSGILHLVVRSDIDRTVEEMGNIKVYRLDGNAKRWTEVRSISDQIFFFGVGFSFSAFAQELEGFSGKDCIMYEEHSFGKYSRGGGKVGVYHLEDGARLQAIELYPCYSNILWPPPSWIWLDDKSKLLGTLKAVIDKVLMRTFDENLKAKYKDLSFVVRSIVSGDGVEPDAPNVAKEMFTLQKFMNEIEFQITQESRSIRNHILGDAVSQVTQILQNS